MSNRIEDLLRADEEALKAKRARFTALTKSIKDFRAALDETREAAQTVATSDGLSRSMIKDAFDLNSSELALLLPPAPRRRGKRSAGDAASQEREAVQNSGNGVQAAGN